MNLGHDKQMVNEMTDISKHTLHEVISTLRDLLQWTLVITTLFVTKAFAVKTNLPL